MSSVKKIVKLYKRYGREGEDGTYWYKLGLMYEVGQDGIKQSLKKAMKLYKKAANQGSAEASYRLGCILLNSKSGTRAEAIKRIRYAAVNGSHAAQLLYFDLNYKRGTNDDDMCLVFLAKAVAANFAPAVYRRAMMSLFGPNYFLPMPKLTCIAEYEYVAGWVFPDTLYKRSEEFGFKKKYQSYMNDLVYKLSLLFDRYAVKENLKEVVSLLNDAAMLGYAPAQYVLGTICEYERLVGCTKAKAFDYYLKAAEQGLIPAQIKVAKMLEFGLDVKKDLKSALEWYKKSGTFFGAKRDYKRLKRYLFWHRQK